MNQNIEERRHRSISDNIRIGREVRDELAPLCVLNPEIIRGALDVVSGTVSDRHMGVITPADEFLQPGQRDQRIIEMPGVFPLPIMTVAIVSDQGRGALPSHRLDEEYRTPSVHKRKV